MQVFAAKLRTSERCLPPRLHIQIWRWRSTTQMETLRDAIEAFRPLADSAFELAPEGKETLAWDGARAVIETWKTLLESEKAEYLEEADFMRLQDKVKELSGAKGKNLFMPIRVAVIGKPHGAELKLLVPLMKKNSLVKRAAKVLES